VEHITQNYWGWMGVKGKNEEQPRDVMKTSRSPWVTDHLEGFFLERVKIILLLKFHRKWYIYYMFQLILLSRVMLWRKSCLAPHFGVVKLG